MMFFSMWRAKTKSKEQQITEIQSLLYQWIDPISGLSMPKLNIKTTISYQNKKPSIILEWPYLCPSMYSLMTQTIQRILPLQCDIKIEGRRSSKRTHSIPELTSINHIIAVSSAKGGVGKSTISINLATALQQEGYAVGLLDADLYGPSLPTLINHNESNGINERNRFIPNKKFGLLTMSIGFLIDSNAPILWRGPMIIKGLSKLLLETEWGALDYLIIDLPPGTGDIHISLCQKFKITGALIVTTPQKIAQQDASKGAQMFKKMNLPLLGCIKNMENYYCNHCQKTSPLFYSAHTEDATFLKEAPWMISIPFHPDISYACDAGEPLLYKNAQHIVGKKFFEAAYLLNTSMLELEACTFSPIRIHKI